MYMSVTLQGCQLGTCAHIFASLRTCIYSCMRMYYMCRHYVVAAYTAPLCRSSTIIRDALMNLEGGMEIEECAGNTSP